MNSANIIDGGRHEDERGVISFVNDFDLSPIQRFYKIHHKDKSVIRAWQGHKSESKWFYCVKGSFTIHLIKMNDWKDPKSSQDIEKYVLSEVESRVLHIPGGYVNGFKANTEDSMLMVYSDFDLEQSKADDFRFEKETWKIEW